MDTAVFLFDKNWQMKFSGSKQKQWAGFEKPVRTYDGELATGNQKAVCFSGHVNYSSLFKKITFHCRMMSSDRNVEIGDNTQYEMLIIPITKKDSIFSIAENNFIAFPNPTKDEFIIKGNIVEKSLLKISLVNLSGQLISELDEGEQEGDYSRIMNLGNLASGIYFVKINIKGKEQVIKIVKQ